MPTEGSRDERVLALTQQIARRFEVGVREHPEDWHMLQRVWVDAQAAPAAGAMGAQAAPAARAEDSP